MHTLNYRLQRLMGVGSIILVHGLGGHLRKLWTHIDSATQKKVFWPKDLLSRDIPRARVMTYRYKSNVLS